MNTRSKNLTSQKMAKTVLFSGFILALFLSAFPASATTFKNFNDLNLPSTDNYVDNFYALTNRTHLSSTFEKDLFIISGESNFDGTVKGDLLIIGGKVNVSGKVMGDLRVIGGDVTISGELDNDLVVIGGKVLIKPNTQISGQSLFIGGETKLDAKITNPAKIISAKTTVNSEINSSIEVTTQNLILGSGSKIVNGITYYAPKVATRENGAILNGQVNFNQITPLQDISFVKRAIINFVSFWLILKFITTLLIAFILSYVFRIFTQRVVDISLNSFGKSLIFGFLTILAVPIVILLLIISLVASPVGFLLLLIFISLIMIVPAISGIMAGALIRRLFNKKDFYMIDFSTVAIGVTVLTFISFVPFLGDITKMLLNFVAIGAVSRHFYRSFFKLR